MKSKQSRISHPFPLMMATASHFVIARKTVKNPFSIKIRSYEVQEKWEFRKYAVSSGSSLAPRQCFGMSHSPARRQNVSTASPLMGPPGVQELFCLLIFSREGSIWKALPILNKESIQYINKIRLQEDTIIFLLLEEPQVLCGIKSSHFAHSSSSIPTVPNCNATALHWEFEFRKHRRDSPLCTGLHLSVGSSPPLWKDSHLLRAAADLVMKSLKCFWFC